MSEECETRMYEFVKIVSKTKADIVRKLNNVTLTNQKYINYNKQATLTSTKDVQIEKIKKHI